jgi:hypothetical protein
VTRPVVDVGYLAGLSDDAVPTLVNRLPSLAPEQQRLLAQALLERDAATRDWRSWNVSRSEAASVLRAHGPELAVLAGH